MDDWLLLAGSNYTVRCVVRRCCRTRTVGYETLDATSGECTDSLRRAECSYFLPLLAVCWPLMQTDTIENNHCLICKILHHSGVHFLFSSSNFIQHNTRLLLQWMRAKTPTRRRLGLRWFTRPTHRAAGQQKSAILFFFLPRFWFGLLSSSRRHFTHGFS